jgi:hypothetical protein
MAAVGHTSTRPRSRSRSASDPFSDPHHRAPPPPPKSSANHQTMTSTAVATRSAAPHNNIVEAVRDTVTVRDSPRNRMGRSHTSAAYVGPLCSFSHRSPSSLSSPVPQSTNTRQIPQPISRRSQSEDSVLQAAAALDRAKTNGKSKTSKKGSRHADVIDRLDFTGVGPSALFLSLPIADLSDLCPSVSPRWSF